MKTHRFLICFGLAIAAGPALAGTSMCGLPDITRSRELHEFLSLRAVEVVKLAASHGVGLAALISPSATFNLGSGDVGRPLGTGVEGARKLARTMEADTYRFLGWDYMDLPADACSKHTVEVEFISSQRESVSRVSFAFEAGLLVTATGWARSFKSGPL